ncbi:nucleotidyltransferase domain-containing protein [Kitasatospora sp. NPDC049285]|uniref:nucleotidyltransferase domain-containing protein n=1 Tax=Kitasatospora sp. NPDC049285 TaxID=3157096 RepID=UPI003440B256
MASDLRTCLPELRSRGLLPECCVAVYVSGSVARGWGNEDSDLDIYVVTADPWTGGAESTAPVVLEPNAVPVAATRVGRMRWEIEYWTESQADQLVRKVSWASFDRQLGAAEPAAALLPCELNFLERLPYAVPLTGEDWLAARRADVASSALASFAASHQLQQAEAFLEDAIGQLNAADLHSSVLSAKMAFGHSVDALLASHGEVGRSWKWRARRFQEVRQDVLAFDEYWGLETMRSYDPDNPSRWVEEVVRTCRKIFFEVVF